MRFALLLLLVLLIQCRSRPNLSEKDLKGAWKTDSVFQYTNGFMEKKAVINDEDNIVYGYDGAGKMTMKKDGEQRTISYQLLDGDSLQYVAPNGRLVSGFRILACSPEKLVLRKLKPPLFPGKNQLSFEVRQFSPASSH